MGKCGSGGQKEAKPHHRSVALIFRPQRPQNVLTEAIPTMRKMETMSDTIRRDLILKGGLIAGEGVNEQKPRPRRTLFFFLILFFCHAVAKDGHLPSHKLLHDVRTYTVRQVPISRLSPSQSWFFFSGLQTSLPPPLVPHPFLPHRHYRWFTPLLRRNDVDRGQRRAETPRISEFGNGQSSGVPYGRLLAQRISRGIHIHRICAADLETRARRRI